MSVLGLLFTRNVSLKTWVETGLLEREKAIYEQQLGQGIFETVYWFTYGSGDETVYQELLKNGRLSPGIKVIPMPRLFRGRLGYNIYSLAMPFIQRKYFDKLHLIKSNQMDGAWTGLIARKVYGIPFYFRTGYTNTLFYERMNGKRDWNFKKFAWLEKMLYEKCDVATVTSEHDRDYICNAYGTDRDKITVLPNYVETEKFYDRNMQERQERLVYVGRLSEQKNLFHTIEAVRNTGMGMDIYGNGDLYADLQEYVKHSDADIELKGSVANDRLPEILNSYKYYILASEYEGMPKTLLEAMACGNLCIGTDVEGIREVITDGVNGFLADGTGVDEIQKAIERAVADEDFREKTKKGKQVIQELYSLQSIIDREYELCKL